MNNKILNILTRYSIATLGLVLVAIGVALSIISDLGTSPISCPPYVLSLWGGPTVGQYTILMHILFVFIQIALLRKKFKAEHLLQLAASFLFGFLTDGAIWALSWLQAPHIGGKVALMLLSCAITAFGISIEVRANAWMLAGEMTTAAIATVTNCRFSNVKIVFDVSLVIISAAISFAIFHNPLGAGEFEGIGKSLLAQTDGIVIGLGTVASAILTGVLIKFSDPVVEKVFGKLLS